MNKLEADVSPVSVQLTMYLPVRPLGNVTDVELLVAPTMDVTSVPLPRGVDDVTLPS